ncbi:acyl-CoA synthetase [Nocardioides sp. AE5]|uniref:acyl-CoA synthetase n=1 Tax=Nocardioides sp. AE5 TaxID=2962573 RepID=UPI00288162CC|nr:acyl-CoA synthetase [Nocardioides sp. AE5]MDT0202236.1 acyl-CoA synthetase [Nocardioides sp. AE5]
MPSISPSALLANSPAEQTINPSERPRPDDVPLGPRHPITVASTTLSHAEVYAAAARVAGMLSGRRRVAVLARPTMETVVAVVGALRAGVEVVPVPPDSGARELAHILTDSTPDAWLGAAPADPHGLGVIPVDTTTVAAATEPAHLDPARIDAAYLDAVPGDRVALVLYTSGTTGAPKGVLLTHGAIRAGLDGLIDAWAWTADDVLAHGLPLFHVHGLILGVLGALRAGSGLIHTGRPGPEAYAAAAAGGATVFFGVPTVWSRIAEAPEHAAALRGARLLVSGSAGLPTPVFERIRELTGHRIAERYGMSETLITVATRADGAPRAGWVGTPLAGVQTRLHDESGAPVPHDGESVGRLEVRGATVFAGYLNRPDATAEAWTDDGWFRTGDVAVIDPEGRHRIVGRESVDLIKSGGYRIGAGEIESVLLGHPHVAECAIIGMPDADLGQCIVAFVVPAAAAVLDDPALAAETSAEVTAYVGSELSAHKRPREVRFVASLPRNEMGKVQKKRLSD